MKRSLPLTDQLRKVIETSGKTRYAIAKETGVGQDTLSRFMSGERGLSMRALDRVAEALGVEIVVRGGHAVQTNCVHRLRGSP